MNLIGSVMVKKAAKSIIKGRFYYFSQFINWPSTIQKCNSNILPASWLCHHLTENPEARYDQQQGFHRNLLHLSWFRWRFWTFYFLISALWYLEFNLKKGWISQVSIRCRDSSRKLLELFQTTQNMSFIQTFEANSDDDLNSIFDPKICKSFVEFWASQSIWSWDKKETSKDNDV